MFDTGRWESHIFYQNWSCRQIIWWRDCDKGIQNKHFCVNNGSSDWLFFENQCIQWEMSLFQQIRSSPHAFPPIMGRQLRYEKYLLTTQEAVTPYKYLSWQTFCHSWWPASTSYNFIRGKYLYLRNFCLCYTRLHVILPKHIEIEVF